MYAQKKRNEKKIRNGATELTVHGEKMFSKKSRDTTTAGNNNDLTSHNNMRS